MYHIPESSETHAHYKEVGEAECTQNSENTDSIKVGGAEKHKKHLHSIKSGWG